MFEPNLQLVVESDIPGKTKYCRSTVSHVEKNSLLFLNFAKIFNLKKNVKKNSLNLLKLGQDLMKSEPWLSRVCVVQPLFFILNQCTLNAGPWSLLHKLKNVIVLSDTCYCNQFHKID